MVKKAKSPGKSAVPARSVGRPSSYSEEIAELICERLINGESLLKITKSKGMPSRSAIHRWCRANPDFAARCAHAREEGTHFLVDKIEEMADDTTELNYQSQKVKIAVAQWRAEKIAPRIYGPRVSTEVSGGATINVVRTTIDVRQLDAAARDAFKQALLAARTIEHDPNEGQG